MYQYCFSTNSNACRKDLLYVRKVDRSHTLLPLQCASAHNSIPKQQTSNTTIMKLTTAFLLAASIGNVSAAASDDSKMIRDLTAADYVDSTTHLKFLVTQPDPLEVCYPDQQWVNYEGTSYIFQRQQYNTMCVDDNQQPQSFEYGALTGYWTTGEPCANACVTGTTHSEQQGCSSSNRPSLSELVGYEYDCENGTCYCLYNQGTLSDQDTQCFDSMNIQGQGYTTSGVSTVTKMDRTCYNLHTQPIDGGTNFPVASPIPMPTPPTWSPTAVDICDRPADYECYKSKSGLPECCNSDYDYTCPPFVTMCDNVASGMTGNSICTGGMNYNCWPSTGRPPCCSVPGGAYVNCPKPDDKDEYQPCEPQPSTTPTRNVSVFLVTFPALNIVYFLLYTYTPLF